jgi:hypothetical protein
LPENRWKRRAAAKVFVEGGRSTTILTHDDEQQQPNKPPAIAANNIICMTRAASVENIHMKQKMMGVTFAIKSREAKDRYLDSQFKNALDELYADIANYGVDVVFRKLIMSYIALEIAQNLGIDYHAATEELYYYMRKRDEETRAALLKLARSIIDRSKYRS